MEAVTMDAITTAMTTAVTSIANAGMGAVGAIVPVAAPIFGALVLVGLCMKTLKKFTGRG